MVKDISSGTAASLDDSAVAEGLGVVGPSGAGVRDPGQVSAQRAGDLGADSGGVVFVGPQFGVIGSRPARQEGPVDDQQVTGVQVVQGGTHAVGTSPRTGAFWAMVREIVGCDTSEVSAQNHF